MARNKIIEDGIMIRTIIDGKYYKKVEADAQKQERSVSAIARMIIKKYYDTPAKAR